MSTERQPFGLNSFLPSGYMSKAEAFAKCLQDKLKSLGSADNSNAREESSKPYGPFSEEEISENVFMQGPLSYKRRSIPEHSEKSQNCNPRTKYFGQLLDKRGTSSDSEDSDSEQGDTDENPAVIHPRVAQIQNEEDRKIQRLASVDSTSSWCSCEDGGGAEEDEEVIDALASQIKGSPPIHNPRLRNFRRKGKEEKLKREKTALPQSNADLFFDFDVECFSPVNVEEENEFLFDFQSEQLKLPEEGPSWDSSDTGQTIISNLLGQPRIVTPPPSPANGKLDALFDKQVSNEDAVLPEEEHVMQGTDQGYGEISHPTGDSSSSNQLDTKQAIVEMEPDSSILFALEAEQSESEFADSEYHHYYRTVYAKDSGICSCEETSSRLGDEDILEVDSCEIATETDVSSNEEAIKAEEKFEKLLTPDYHASLENEPIVDVPRLEEQEVNGDDSHQLESDESKKRDVTAPVMVLCEGVMVEENYLPSPRMKLRRCSSLKSWKTPPGTPGRKKIVRFADALGLDLADVRTFLDEIPKIPNSAFEDLHYELPAAPPPPTTERTLIPLFKQPGTQMDFLQKVRQNNVSLESAVLSDVALMAISGIIRVRNLSFHKTVHVRYSKDNWTTFSDLQATFVPNSSDGFCDNFSFTLYGHTLNIGDRLEFAIRYECSAGQFWDSNCGQNYAFQCLPRNSSPLFPPLGSSPVDTPWSKFY